MGQPRQTVDGLAEDPADDLTIHGSDDFLADQGIEDPDEFRVKSHLCHEIAKILEAKGLKQVPAAKITGLSQADISRIANHRHGSYEVWRLMKTLSTLGADVLITVNPTSGFDRGVVHSRNVDDEESEPAPTDEQKEAPSCTM